MDKIWIIEQKSKSGTRVYSYIHDTNIKMIIKSDGSIKYKNY